MFFGKEGGQNRLHLRADGQMHHIAAVFDDDADTLRLYLDGQLDHELPGVTAEKVVMAAGAVYKATIGTAGHDTLQTTGDLTSVEIKEGATLIFQIDGEHPFTAGDYTLVVAGESGENGLTGADKFRVGDGLGAYLDSVFEVGQTLKVRTNRDLHMGDANLDWTTDVRDFNKWNAAKSTSGTDWASGDFDGNGVTDVRDFNKWNAAKFTSAWDKAPLVEGQIPEPSTLVLLSLGVIGLSGYAGGQVRRFNQ